MDKKKKLKILKGIHKKDTNPKEAFGSQKIHFTTLSFEVLSYLAVAMTEGALKYGAHNYRVKGGRSSTYINATLRHLFSYQMGEDIDPDSELHHIIKAMSSLMVLMDSILNGKCNDDRPKYMKKNRRNTMKKCNDYTGKLIKKYPNPVAPFIQKRKIKTV